MKKSLLFLCLLCISSFVAQAQDFPATSPLAKFYQRVGLTDVEIEYSRPSINDREIFGGLVPYEKLWRTGANAATKITFSTEVNIQDKKIKSGSYSVFTIPGKDNFKFILNSDEKASTGTYDASKNVLEISVPVRRASSIQEQLLFTFENVSKNKAELHFHWADVEFFLPFSVEVDALVEENIKRKLNSGEANYGFYNQAASYYLENGKDLKNAYEWSRKSVDMSPQYWNVLTYSQVLAKMGKYEEAIKQAHLSRKLASEAGVDYYVKLNSENIKEWEAKK